MCINSYKLKANTNVETLIDDGFRYHANAKKFTKFITLKNSIVLILRVSLVDFSLNIEIIDDCFCQPYHPFYLYQNGEIKMFNFLKEVAKKYNKEMDKINSFELIE